MRHYTVHARAVPAGTDPDFVLVKEGFNWPALFVPVLWLLFRAQWLGLAAYVVAAALLSVAAQAGGQGEGAQSLLALLFALLVAAEANNWRRWRLGAAGYRMAGVVLAPDLETAEAHWLQTLAEAPARDAATPLATAAAPTPAASAGAPAATAPAARPGGRRNDPLQPFATPFDPV